MKPVDRRKWFWTPDRLFALVAHMREIAERDKAGWYFDDKGLEDQLWHHLKDEGSELADGPSIGNALSILVYLKVLKKGRGGSKKSGYRRKFRPNKMPHVTWGTIDEYREYRRERYRL